LVELDDGRCRWPLGDLHRVATLFCGGNAVPGFSYCQHHLRMARYDCGPQSERGSHRVERGSSRTAEGAPPV
jgi:hypothetical protein